MDLALILDVLLAVLLVATIVYAIVLNRRLAVLRANRGELEEFLTRMNEATSRAEASLKGIRQAAERAQRGIDEPMQKAQALRDELLFLIERADSSAERIATSQGTATVAPPTEAAAKPSKRGAKTRGRATPMAEAPAEPASDEDGEAVRSKAERDLMNALRNVR